MPKNCFEPVVNKTCRVLILGSIPGEESLKRQQYYAHPRNAFWRLISEDLSSKTYEQKCAYLLDHNIALWDVLQSAERKGSLDSNIKNEVQNDFAAFLKQYPNIKHIFFNGKKAQSSFKKHFTDIYMSYNCTALPSSSPAYTLAFEEKKKVWREALTPLLQKLIQ